MPFPVPQFKIDDQLVETVEAWLAERPMIPEGVRVVTDVAPDPRYIADVLRFLDAYGYTVTRECDPFGGQIARVQIDAYGESAAEVESTLLEYGTRCDAASQAPEVGYGRCVIERNLEEEWGKTYSWRGRLVLHPTIGTLPSSERAASAIQTGKTMLDISAE